MIQPEARPRAGKKAKMAAMARRQKSERAVALEGGVAVNLKRNQRVVLRRDGQGRDADRAQKVGGGLSGVIVRSGAESKKWRSKGIVEGPDGIDLSEGGGMVDAGRKRCFSALSDHSAGLRNGARRGCCRACQSRERRRPNQWARRWRRIPASRAEDA